MRRKIPITTGSIHHVYSKSIYKFIIFTCPEEYEHMQELLAYCRFSGQKLSFTHYNRTKTKNVFERIEKESAQWTPLVKVLAVCLMPTHIHLIIHQMEKNGADRFLHRLFNSYSHYFNLRHNRRGPLWQERFGNTPIDTPEDLERTLDYVRNNPVKSKLVGSPSQWPYLTCPEPGSGEVYWKSRPALP